MGFEQNVSKDVLENFAFNVLSTMYPHAYLRFEPRRIGTKIGVTKPDFVFALPEEEREVYLEVTKSQLRPGIDCKSGQKGILHEYVARHSEYAALVLYLQNFVQIATIENSMMILDALARGKLDSQEAQRKVNDVALKSGVPHDLKGEKVDWYTLYDQVRLVMKPRN